MMGVQIVMQDTGLLLHVGLMMLHQVSGAVCYYSPHDTD